MGKLTRRLSYFLCERVNKSWSLNSISGSFGICRTREVVVADNGSTHRSKNTVHLARLTVLSEALCCWSFEATGASLGASRPIAGRRTPASLISMPWNSRIRRQRGKQGSRSLGAPKTAVTPYLEYDSNPYASGSHRGCRFHR
jgi:hypothetical protein